MRQVYVLDELESTYAGYNREVMVDTFRKEIVWILS